MTTASLAHGPLSSSPHRYFLLTDFLDMRSSRSSGPSSTSSPSLPVKLAKLHTTPARTPSGYESPQFGFPVPTCCGSTEQDNTYTDDWADFFGQRRLRGIAALSRKVDGERDGVGEMVERVVQEVVPKLLRKGHLGGKEGVRPVVVHGDVRRPSLSPFSSHPISCPSSLRVCSFSIPSRRHCSAAPHV